MRIDTHMHFTPAGYRGELTRRSLLPFPLAVLPLPDVDQALSELHHALDVLGLAGVVLLSNVLGRYPGDPEWVPPLGATRGAQRVRSAAPDRAAIRIAGGRPSRVGL